MELFYFNMDADKSIFPSPCGFKAQARPLTWSLWLQEVFLACGLLQSCVLCYPAHGFCAPKLLAPWPPSLLLARLQKSHPVFFLNVFLLIFFNKTQNYCCVLKDPTWSNSTFIFKVTLSLEYRRGEMSTSSQHFREQMRSMKLSTGE